MDIVQWPKGIIHRSHFVALPEPSFILENIWYLEYFLYVYCTHPYWIISKPDKSTPPLSVKSFLLLTMALREILPEPLTAGNNRSPQNIMSIWWLSSIIKHYIIMQCDEYWKSSIKFKGRILCFFFANQTFSLAQHQWNFGWYFAVINDQGVNHHCECSNVSGETKWKLRKGSIWSRWKTVESCIQHPGAT